MPNSACVFNDVTVGNNSVPGEAGYPSGQYSASVGYDLASGLGSVNVTNLVNAWTSVSFRPTTTTLTLNGGTTPITIAHGTPVTVGIAVTPNSGTGAPSGDVSLLAATNPSDILISGQVAVASFSLNASGTASGTTNELPGSGRTSNGYFVTAHYAGNSTSATTGVLAPSDSSPGVLVIVTPENSTTTASGVDGNRNPISGGTFPFGTFLFVRADVAGLSGQGVPTGQVSFTDSGTCNGAPCAFPGQIFSNPVLNPSPLNSQGSTSIGPGAINFDAGNHSISASYQGDNSFNPSTSTAPVTFTIEPGFTAVSGLANVNIASPGGSGTTTVGIVASTGFTAAVTATCSGLPAETTCSPTSITGNGPNNVVTGTITVSTTAPHTTMLQPNQRRFYYALIGVAGLPFGGVLVLVGPRKRRWSALLGLMTLALLVTLLACGGGGGGGGGSQQDSGTPTGSYTVTVTATAGSLTQKGTFTLTVQ